MTPGSEAPSPSVTSGRAVRWGVLALVAVVVVLATQPAWQVRLREAGFDALQLAAPRVPRSSPVLIVAIDDASLAAHGQWPWPRTLLADLVERLADHEPAAIGIDVLMPEPDRLSPERLVPSIGRHDPQLAERLARLPSNDQVLGEALAAAAAVLPIVGAASSAGGRLHVAPVLVTGSTGDPSSLRLPRYPAAIANLELLDRAAAGHGVISGEPTGAVFRRFPLVFDLNGTLAPAFGVEMLRLLERQRVVRLSVLADEVRTVAIGRRLVPTESDGAIRVHFARTPRPPRLAAADVLAGRATVEQVQGRLVLIGATALGLAEGGATALGELEPGVEIQAQLIENLVDHAWLLRPRWALALELAAVIVSGLLLVWASARWSPGRAAALAVGVALAFPAAALAAFAGQRLLIDATPGLYLLAIFGVMSVSALADAAQRRRALERAIQAQREREAFVTGELAAARRIQTGMLPPAAALCDERRLDVAAEMRPAREVGGDLYDYFMLDERQLGFLIGDVSGKGVAASLFMALAKSLCKSLATRDAAASPDAVLTAAGTEIARDNAEQMFVTAVLGKLDLDTGALQICNAGHDEPVRVHAADVPPRPLACDGGPPLCAIDGFAYADSTHHLQPGDAICLVSDGVTEARDAAGTLYGHARLLDALVSARRAGADARAMVAALCDDLQNFVAGAEPADDLTILVIRWLGPRPAA